MATSVTPRPTPLLRPALHAGTGLLALLLGVLPRSGAIACGVLGVLMGWVVFPLTPWEARLRRPGERYLGGLRTYPLAVLGLVLLLPAAQAAAAWGVLAWGDAAAAIVGRRVKTPRIFGHPKLTWSGTAAHVLVGGGMAFGLGAGVASLAHLCAWVDAGPLPGFLACVLAALAAVVSDGLLRLADDNLVSAAAAGLVLHVAQPLLV